MLKKKRAAPHPAIERYADGLRSLMGSLLTVFEIILIMAAFAVAAHVTDSVILEVMVFLTLVPLAIWMALATKPFLDWTGGRLSGRQMLLVLLVLLAAYILVPFAILKTVEGIIASQINPSPAPVPVPLPPN